MNRIVLDRITKNIYEDILELSDLRMQRKLWLNESNHTGLISSYVELMCRLFDDNQFDDFIDNQASNIGLSKNQIIELDKLRGYLKNYIEKNTDSEIIDDPNWKKVVDQANFVTTIWKLNF